MFVREIALTIQKLNIVEEIFDKASFLTLELLGVLDTIEQVEISSKRTLHRCVGDPLLTWAVHVVS